MALHILLGKTRWRRRRAIPRQNISGVDRHGRPNFLYLTDTQRKAAVVEQEFLEYRRHQATFKPEVRVLSELIDDLQVRFGDGSAVLSERMCALAAERVLIEQAESWTWLASMGSGRVIGQALAELHRDMAEARVRTLPRDVPHRHELSAALAELGRRLGSVKGYTTRARAIENLLTLAQSPTPAMAEWLRRTSSVVIDDILHPSPLRREFLLELCKTWAVLGVHVVLSFETGRDLGGQEAELFFEYGDCDGVAYALKPFLITRAFRQAAFDRLIAQDDAELWVSLRKDVIEVAPGEVPQASDTEDLSDFLYSGRTLPCDTAASARDWLGGKVALVECADPIEEIREIARQVKGRLLAGDNARDLVVALPELSVYAPAVRAVFADHGIPFSISAGSNLSQSPVATAVRRIITLALEGFGVTDLLALLRSDLVQGPPDVDPTQVHAWCRAAGVSRGRPADWAPALRSWHARERYPGVSQERMLQTLDQLDAFCAALTPHTEDMTPSGFRDRVLATATTLRIPDNLGRSDAAPDAAAENLHAWGAVLRVLDDLVLDLSVVDDGAWPAQVLADNFDHALQRATFNPDPVCWSRVQVVGVLELRGITPAHTWLGGLVRGAFPGARPTPFLIPRSAARSLEPVDPLAEARYLFCSLLRNALGDDNMTSLTLSWPATRGGKPVARSPMLEDLLDLPTAHPEGKLFGELVVDHPAPSGRRPLARSDAIRAAAGALAAWLPVMSPADSTAVTHQRAVLDSRDLDAFGPHDGVLPRPPSRPEEMSVTQLETFLRCPQRYWYRYVLGLDEVEEWDPELDARRRGTAIHEILERFLLERELQPLKGVRFDEAAAHLHQVANTVLDELDAQGGFEPALQDHNRHRWLAGLVDRQPRGVLAAWLADEVWGPRIPIEPLAVELPFEGLSIGDVKLRGKADRVDRVGNQGLLVTDYKTGKAPSANKIRRGLVLQPIAYAAAAAARWPDEPVASVYYSLKNAETLRRSGWCGDGAVWNGLASRWDDTVELDQGTFSELLDHASGMVRHLADGRFHTTLASSEEAGCQWCPYRRVCALDEPRNSRISEGDGDWARPIPEDDAP